MGVNKFSPSSRNYYKSNFIELLDLITPNVYQNEDILLSGTEVNPKSDVINSHITLANNISDVLSISSVVNTQTSTLNTIGGISQYFIKQNELTKINPFLFETKILNPLGTTLANYETSSAFNDYLSGTLLPSIVLATETEPGALEENIDTLSVLTGNSDASSVHNFLVDTLGWFYFLNTSADGGLDYSPSSYVLQSLNSLYAGDTLETVDGIKGLAEYIWKNYSTCSVFSNLNLIPSPYVSGAPDAITEASAGELPTHTSGTQRLSNLQTWIDVIYSPLYIDQQDYSVKDAFISFMDSNLLLDDRVSKGPHRKFLNAAGFSFADISNEIENIGLIYDIENVREEHLQYIADLIGFKLRGQSPAKWRHQLRLAVDLYKKSGTLEAVQTAINALIIDSVFDVSGEVQELWESYIPHMIWYALGTESPLFKNLNTWTPDLAVQAGVYNYSPSSLEENLKIVTDSIISDLYKKFPKQFSFFGEVFPCPRFHQLDEFGHYDEEDVYTLVGDPNPKPYAVMPFGEDYYIFGRREAELHDELCAFDAALAYGPLGYGVYIENLEYPTDGTRPKYLKFEGDLEFLFSYRNKINLALPPFEEIKYYKDCSLTAEMVDLLVERLKCFRVKESFADYVGDFALSSAVTAESNLGTLNEFLMFFSSVQIPSNFNDVMLSISDYEKNLLNLWNGKSSHLFIDFDDTDFDFSKKTLEGDSRYAALEASRVTKEFSPAHAITRVNINASAADEYDMSSVKYMYLGLDHDDGRSSYTSGSIIGGFEYSGVDMGSVSPGDNGGRGGLNTFKRESVDSIYDSLLSSTTAVAAVSNVGRRDLRRRNFKYLLPKEGYYDRTGFNGPVGYDPSTLEHSLPSSVGELTLGYVPSAGKFFPIVDHVTPSGVWDPCETLESNRTFSGVDTSTTFPYRGLSALGSNAKMPEVSVSSAKYIDRCQVPKIYITMHDLFEAKARDYANEQIKLDPSSYDPDSVWKNNIQSFANSAIASGLVLNSFEDYVNFKFGKNMQKLHRDYCKYFAKHGLNQTEEKETGGNILGHVFGNGLFNCQLSKDGSAVGNLVASSVTTASAINAANVWHPEADGTFVASDSGQSVIPLSGTWVSGNVNNAELRNPAILSGIEFCDISGAPGTNQFTIFDVDKRFRVVGVDNPLINNRLIKCKSAGGLPRLRFDLSSYGDRRNYLIKDHKFKLNIKALMAEEHTAYLGGGQLGVWIHTQPVDGVIWTWMPNKKWRHSREDTLSIAEVLGNLSHRYNFVGGMPPTTETEFCLGNTSLGSGEYTNDVTLNNIQDSYFENFTIEFDTRNYTIHNNYEYLDIIPIEEDIYKITEQVHRDDTNYIIEIFQIPNSNKNKYTLIDEISLEDSTLRDWAGIETGHGTKTKGIPLRPFVKEDKILLDKEQLVDILRFYNGLMGQSEGKYTTPLASRDAAITSGTLELSGGSRLNNRVSPEWGSFTTQAIYGSYTNTEFDN